MERNFIVTLARYNLVDPNSYVVQGYFQGNSIAGSHMSARLDGHALEVNVSVREGLSIRQKYFSKGIGYEDIDREYDLWITLPDDYRKGRVLKVFQEHSGRTKCVFRIPVKEMIREQAMPDGYLETFKEDGDQIRIGGWAVGHGACRIAVTDRAGKSVPSSFTRLYRQDIAENYPERSLSADDPDSLSFGYEVTFRRPAGHRIWLTVTSDDQEVSYPIDLNRGLKGLQGSTSLIYRAYVYLKRNGFSRTVKRAFEKLSETLTGQRESYMSWRRRHEPTREELNAQSRSHFLYEPLISIAVPLYRTQPSYLRALVDSVLAQTYQNWQLCLSDGSGEDSPLTQILADYSRMDRRIRVIDLHRQMGISENTNAALSIADGDYIAFADHDDTLSPDALYECVKEITRHPDADLIYSDEDKVSMDGRTYFEPHFKSDFNVDLLSNMNYICHLLVVKRSLYEQVGGMRPEYDGAQDYDFTLRCVERAKRISHIPRVLYHWRTHRDSTSENPASKMYAFEAGQRAVQAHFDRIGVAAHVSMGAYPGLYRVKYLIGPDQPLISIIIPNMDHVSDLDTCVSTIIEESTYRNFEFIIVENNSTKEETFEYYRMMEQRYDFFHVVDWNDAFNYSAINNFGVSRAHGDYLLFLNNDTKMITRDCLEEMLGPCQRPEVGAVGALLFYGDDTIQHAGVIIGYGGIAGHAFAGMKAGSNGYFSRIICQCDLSAVTAACMMVRRDVFEEVGGFDEQLAVAFNDVDLCLKMRRNGYLVVYDPNAQMYHYESKSRGAEDTPAKIARFNSEADLLLKRWPDILQDGDPYYNPNLSLDSNDFRLKP